MVTKSVSLNATSLPLPARAAAPAAPNDPSPVDFSTIDTPQKAALLPALTLPVMINMISCIRSARNNGEGMGATLHEQLNGATNVDMKYELPTWDGAVKATGTEGDQAVSETWNLSAQGIDITGTIGKTSEKVTWSVGADGIHMDGQIGDMPVHAVYLSYNDGFEFDMYGLGKAGTDKFSEGFRSTDPAHGDTTGAVGKSGTLIHTAVVGADGVQLAVAGAGLLAGTGITYTQEVHMNEPPPDPNPPPDPKPDPDPPLPPPWPDPPDPNGGDDGGDGT